MTVSVQTPIVEYAPNGVTTVFAYPFAVLSEDDLAVAMDGAPVTSGFTVSGIGDESGGSITFSSAPVGTSQVTVAAEIVHVIPPPVIFTIAARPRFVTSSRHNGPESCAQATGVVTKANRNA